MGLAYEEYCDAMYEREFCMSDIDFGCTDCQDKAKELESCYDGYHLFRNELEKILDVIHDHINGNTRDLFEINLNILNMCHEAGVNYTDRFSNLKAVI